MSTRTAIGESCLEESVAMSIDSEEFAIPVRAVPPGTAGALLPQARLGARRGRCGSGDVSAGLALVR